MKINFSNWYKEKHSSWILILIAILMVDVITDPTNLIFQMKYFVFGAIFLFWIPKLIYTKIVFPKALVFILLFMSFFMPFYALSLGLFNNFLNNTDIGGIVYFNSFFFFALLVVIVDARIELTKIFNYSSLLIVLITFGAYSILVLDPITFGSLYQYFVIDKQVAIYSLRNYGNFTILMMFYKTSPLLVFPLSYYLYNLLIIKEIKNITLQLGILVSIAVTLFLSGTRANILSLVLILLFYLTYYAYTKSRLLFVFISGFYLLFLLYTLSAIGDVLLNAQEISNKVKFGHFISYIEHFYDHLAHFIFGQGLGGAFYSSGIHQITNITELSYFELVRIWGLPITLVFVFILLIPVYKEIRSRKITHLFIAYIAYLFIAGTNPLLLSSTGMVVLVYVFSEVYQRQNKIKKKRISIRDKT